jgi:hypothetical protein
MEGGRKGGLEGGKAGGSSGGRDVGRGREAGGGDGVGLNRSAEKNARTKSVIIFTCMCKRQWGLLMPKQSSPHLVLLLLQLLHLAKHHRLVCLGAPHYLRHESAIRFRCKRMHACPHSMLLRARQSANPWHGAIARMEDSGGFQ